MNLYFLQDSFNKVAEKGWDFTDLVSVSLGILLWVAGVVAIIYLIYSGILYLTAAGNPDAAKKGQQGIVNAIIGIIIIVLAYVIASSVAGLLGSAT